MISDQFEHLKMFSFWRKWRKRASRRGGGHLFPQHNFNLSPKMVIFGEDQKCSLGPKMKNKPNFFFFDNRGFPNWGGGGSAAWEFFPHNPVFFSECVPNTSLVAKFETNASGAIWWPNLQLMQVAVSGGQFCN